MAQANNRQGWLVPTPPHQLTLPTAPQSALTSILPGVYGTPDRTPGDPAAPAALRQVYLRYLGPNPHPSGQ